MATLWESTDGDVWVFQSGETQRRWHNKTHEIRKQFYSRSLREEGSVSGRIKGKVEAAWDTQTQPVLGRKREGERERVTCGPVPLLGASRALSKQASHEEF